MANSPCCYQNKLQSQQTVMEQLSDNKTFSATNQKSIQGLDLVNDQLFGLDVVKIDNEDKEPKIGVLFSDAKRKTEEIKDLLENFWHFLRCGMVKRPGDGCRHALSSNGRAKLAWMCTTRSEKRHWFSCGAESVPMIYLPMQHHFSPLIVALRVKNKLNESLVCGRKNST